MRRGRGLLLLMLAWVWGAQSFAGNVEPVSSPSPSASPGASKSVKHSDTTPPGTIIGGSGSSSLYFIATLNLKGGLADTSYKNMTAVAQEPAGFKCSSDAPFLYQQDGTFFYCVDLPLDQVKYAESGSAKYSIKMYDPKSKTNKLYKVNGNDSVPPFPDFHLEEPAVQTGSSAGLGGGMVGYPSYPSSYPSGSPYGSFSETDKSTPFGAYFPAKKAEAGGTVDGFYFKGSLQIGEGKLYNAGAYSPVDKNALGLKCGDDTPYAYSVKEAVPSIYCMDLAPPDLVKHGTMETGKSKFTYIVFNKKTQWKTMHHFKGWVYDNPVSAMELEEVKSIGSTEVLAPKEKLASKTKAGSKIGSASSPKYFVGNIILGAGKIYPGYKPTGPVDGFKCDGEAPYPYSDGGSYIYCMDTSPDEFPKHHTSSSFDQNYTWQIYDPQTDSLKSYVSNSGNFTPPPPTIQFEGSFWDSPLLVKEPGPVTSADHQKYSFQGNLTTKPKTAVPIEFTDCGENEALAVKQNGSEQTYIYCFNPGWVRKVIPEDAKKCVENFKTVAPEKFQQVRIPKDKVVSRALLEDCSHFVETRISKTLDHLTRELWPALLATLETDAYFSGEAAERSTTDFCIEAVEAAGKGRSEVVKEAAELTLLRAEKDRIEPPNDAEATELELAKDDEFYPAHVNAFKLSRGEYGGIRSYTGNGYRTINRSMRTGKFETDALRKTTSFLRAGLTKLPDYRGVVKRMSELPPEVLAQHAVGAVVEYPAFTSTSKKAEWSWSGDSRFLIYSAHGKLVETLSSSPQEEEVLFDAGTKFKVLDVRDTGTGNKEFILREVP